MQASKWHGRAPAAWALVVLTAAAVGCAAGSGRSRGTSTGASTSELAVRGFLDGANADAYPQMSDLFGTRDGPAVERFGVTDVERRMIFLAGILKHGSYELRQANLEQLGPERVRWEARLTGTRKGAVVVPIITVPDRGGRWYVEQLNLDALTASSAP